MHGPSPLPGGSSQTQRDESSIESLAARVDHLEATLASLRALLIRAYEDTPRAAADLLRARRGSSYRDAYMAQPLVTVRIGAYAGGEVLLTRALASVREQTYPRWEAIIVCDGPDEETAARIVSLNDPRITCVQRPRNGPYADDVRARWLTAGAHPFNEAVALGRGAWIAPIDQDDEWMADHLEVLLAAALRTGAEVVYGVGRAKLPDGSETYFGAWPPALTDFGFQSALYHADLVTFLYDVNAYLADEPADWNLARRMLEAGVRFEFVEKIVTNYFVEDDKTSVDWWGARARDRGPFGSQTSAN
jgi:glycosyltransferase involved in cell wall biosynthesis